MVERWRQWRNTPRISSSPPPLAVEPLGQEHEQYELTSLAPRYMPGEHDIYLKHLDDAVSANSDARNIALTGAYGTGKSSILKEFAARRSGRILSISLSSLGLNNNVAAGQNDKLSTNNLIQREIVKQLLYTETPNRTPESHHRRIARKPRHKDVGLALLLSVAIICGLALFGVIQPIISHTPELWWKRGAGYIFITSLIAILLYAVVRTIRGKFFASQVSAGGAAITLSEKSGNFFDEHLDAIVYTLEVNRRNIIIFEDIDRFEDTSIFESLRALNTVLNNAKQLKQRPIRFIYALRDSVFERIVVNDADIPIDAARTELVRANRTKFFDLQIPVVPFITHRNARDIFVKEFRAARLDPPIDLINIAAGNLADMRLVHNILNEYRIYRDRLYSTANRVPGLTEENLFALVLYKNIHMSEFESIRLGTSALDKVHADWRRIVDSSLKKLLTEEKEVYIALSSAPNLDERCTQFTTKLIAKLQVLAESIPTNGWANQKPTILIGGKSIDDPLLFTFEFWDEIINGSKTIEAAINRYQSQTYNFTFSAKDLAEITELTLNPEEWHRYEITQLEAKLSSISRQIQFLQHHSWAELYRNHQYSLEGNRTFAKVVQEFVTSQLGRDLIAHGYIDHNFTLYTSRYHDELVKPKAMNYIIHHIDKGEPDYTYNLDPDDVSTLLSEKEKVLAHSRTILNIPIVDYILQNDPDNASFVLDQLSRWQPEDFDFLDAYFSIGNEQVDFIRLVAHSNPATFEYIISRMPVDSSKQLAYFDAALSISEPLSQYTTNNQVQQFVVDHIGSFDILKHDYDHTRSAIRTLAEIGGKITDVTSLSKTAIDEILVQDNYVITPVNLTLMADSSAFSLDSIRTSEPRLYQHITTNHEGYLESLSTIGQHSISGNEHFAVILNELIASNDKELQFIEDVISMAHPSCEIRQIDQVPEFVWKPLADAQKISPTVENIVTYLAHSTQLDPHIAKVLNSTEKLLEADTVGEEVKLGLATQLLSASSLIDLDHRILLIYEMKLETYLPPSSIPNESGDIGSMLIEYDIVEDKSPAFEVFSRIDWPTLESAISSSKEIPTFISPEILLPKYISSFLSSEKISDEIKNRVIDHLSEYVESLEDTELEIVLGWLAQNAVKLSPENVLFFTEQRLNHANTLSVIANSSERLGDDDLRSILRALGDKYADIADPGTKRPRFPKDSNHTVILKRLNEAKVISTISEKDGNYHVTLYQK